MDLHLPQVFYHPPTSSSSRKCDWKGSGRPVTQARHFRSVSTTFHTRAVTLENDTDWNLKGELGFMANLPGRRVMGHYYSGERVFSIQLSSGLLVQ